MSRATAGWLFRFMSYLERGHVFEALESISKPASAPPNSQQAHNKGE